MYDTTRANPVSKWLGPATQHKKNACAQVSCKLPLRYGCVYIAILRAHRENVHANFHCGSVRPSSLSYIPSYVYRHVSVLQILLKNMNVRRMHMRKSLVSYP